MVRTDPKVIWPFLFGGGQTPIRQDGGSGVIRRQFVVLAATGEKRTEDIIDPGIKKEALIWLVSRWWEDDEGDE